MERIDGDFAERCYLRLGILGPVAKRLRLLVARAAERQRRHIDRGSDALHRQLRPHGHEVGAVRQGVGVVGLDGLGEVLGRACVWYEFVFSSKYNLVNNPILTL